MATSVSHQIRDIRPGQVVEFVGYSDTGVEPVFTVGQLIRIESIDEVDMSMQAVPVDGDGGGDTVFIEEITVLGTTEEVAEVAAEESEDDEVQLAVAAASSKFPRKTEKVAKGKPIKAKAKTPAKPAAKIPAKAAVKAPAKSAATKAKPEKIKAARRAEEQSDLLDMIDVEASGDIETTVEPVLEAEVVSKIEVLPIVEDSPTHAVVHVSAVSTEAGRVADSDRVASILAQQDALDAAKALVAQAEETYFTLGGVLSHIYYEGIHKTLGYDGKRGFEAYVEKELGVAYRKAMYLIDIYTKFRSLGVDERRLSQIGWSKAKELTRFATTDNFDELVTAASTKSREELIEHLRSSYVNAEGGANVEQARRVKLNFSLFADQAETVTRALDASKERANSDNPNVALEAICAEWLQLTEGIEVTLEDAIRHIELRHGVRLVPQSAVDVADAVEAVVQ